MNRLQCLKNKVKYTFNSFDVFNHTQLVTPSLVDNIRIDSFSDADGKEYAMFIRNDIFFLFNQQRLSALGSDGVKQFLDGLQSRSSSLQSLRSKISDSDLMNICKSRYIQSPSELLAWSKYLDRNYQQILNDIKLDNDEKKLAEAYNNDTSEAAPSVEVDSK